MHQLLHETYLSRKIYKHSQWVNSYFYWNALILRIGMHISNVPGTRGGTWMDLGNLFSQIKFIYAKNTYTNSKINRNA